MMAYTAMSCLENGAGQSRVVKRGCKDLCDGAGRAIMKSKTLVAGLYAAAGKKDGVDEVGRNEIDYGNFGRIETWRYGAGRRA